MLCSEETGNQGEPATPETDEPQVPVEKIRMTLKPSAVSKSANKSVLEKLGNSDTMTTATIGKRRYKSRFFRQKGC